MNGDGKIDLIGGTIGTATGNWSMAVALSNGDGTFQPYSLTTLATSGFGSGWTWQMADVDGDGKMDAVGGTIGTATGNWSMAVALANGDGTFQAPILSALAVNGYGSAWSWRMADVDGDGKFDAVGAALISRLWDGI